MPKTYSMDLRERVAKAVDDGDTPEEVAEMFGVSRAWVYRLLQRRNETGTLEPNLSGRTGRPAKLAGYSALLHQLTQKHRGITLAELQQKLPVRVGLSTLHKALQREKIVLEKSRLPR